MKVLISSLFSLALCLGSAPDLQAQTATHLSVPSANMVVLSGTNFSTTTSWAVWQNANWAPGSGHYTVPIGKVLVVTDLVFNMSSGNGYGILSLTLWQNNYQILPGYTLRFNKANNFQTFERTFTSGLRIPAGTALDFSLYNASGTATLDNVMVYGYFTN
jgi:hypothetical protein